MNLIKKTSLQETNDVVDTLNWKIKSIEEKGLPVESGLADYIDMAISNLTSELAYVSEVKKQVSDREKDLKEQIDTIKTDGAVFLKSLGIEKLEGVICSSVSILKAREESTETTTTKVFTPLVDELEIQELLIALGKAEMREVTTTKTLKAIPAKLKINKRKVITPEVIEEKSM
jgi:hypothetical protein